MESGEQTTGEFVDDICLAEELIDICIKIYNARNVTLDAKEIESQLRRIDKLFRDENLN
jgi:hypothetical protein